MRQPPKMKRNIASKVKLHSFAIFINLTQLIFIGEKLRNPNLDFASHHVIKTSVVYQSCITIRTFGMQRLTSFSHQSSSSVAVGGPKTVTYANIRNIKHALAKLVQFPVNYNPRGKPTHLNETRKFVEHLPMQNTSYTGLI